MDNVDVDKRLDRDLFEYVSKRIEKSPDILRNITPSVNKAGDENLLVKFKNHLVTIARGCFLYAKLTLDLIEASHLVIKSSGFNVLPKSLSEIFLLELNLRFPTLQSFQKAIDIFSVCLASPRPLIASDIYFSVCALYISPPWSRSSFDLLLKTLARFLVVQQDNSVMFFHPRFRDWLTTRTEDESTKFLCNKRVGHLAFILRLSRLGLALDAQQSLDLCHHILDSDPHINIKMSFLPMEILPTWISLVSEDVSEALGCDENVVNPDYYVSRLLLLAGASPDIVTEYKGDSFSPILCIFCHKGFMKMVSLLLEFKVDVNLADSSGCSALSHASMEGKLECVRLLVDHGARLGLRDYSGCSALVHAARKGHLSIMEYLLHSDWYTLSQQDVSLVEAVQQAAVAAAYAGHIIVLEYLLDMAEVQVNKIDTLMSETPLCAASAAGKIDCCEVLLERGASAGTSNLQQNSPLHIVAKEGHFTICDLLVRKGANIEQKDAHGRTPLVEAVKEGHLAIIEYLLSKNAQIDSNDYEGFTPLLWACEKGQTNVVSVLISAGADLTTVDSQGRSALHHAAVHGSPLLVELLLSKGAMMENKDHQGMSPLDSAVTCGRLQIIESFLKKGARLRPTTWTSATEKPYVM